ncbi:hypothetical protein BCR36DRAFT_410016, partial [Piromyces finnis]
MSVDDENQYKDLPESMKNEIPISNKIENISDIQDNNNSEGNEDEENIIIEENDNEDNKSKYENEEIVNNSSTPRNTNSPVSTNSKGTTPTSKSLSNKNPKLVNNKETLLLKDKINQQKIKEKNKLRYLTEEEINLAFKWFTNGKQIISSNDIKTCFDQYFTNISKNDKKYYVIGGIKQYTRNLVNTKEEKAQSEMFNSTQSISSLKKMLLKYPFKMKDYDNAFSILCGSDQTDIMSKEILNKYIDIFKQNEVPVKNDIDKILKCFDKDKDGELGISD